MRASSAIDCAAARAAPGVVAVLTARGSRRWRQAAARDLAHEGLLRDADPAARARQGALCRRADRRRHRGEPLSRRGCAELIEIEFEPLPPSIDPVAGACSDGAPLLHEEAGTNVLVAREFKRGDVDAAIDAGAGARRRPLPHAPQDRGGDRAARLPRRIRGRPRRADLAFGDADPRHHPRCAVRRARSAGPPAARGRARCRRRLRRQGLALSGGDFRLRGGASRSRAPVKWTSDRMEDLAATSQAFDEIVDAELGARPRRPRRWRCAPTSIGDVGAYSIYPWTAALEPVQVVSFLPGPYRIEHYRGRVQAVATSKAPTGPYRGVGRPISTFVMERLIDMAAAKLGARSEGDPPAQSRAARMSFPTRSRPASCGTSPASSNASNAACDAIDYDGAARGSRPRRARPANGSASASRATRS